MNSLVQRVERAICERTLARDGEHILVAVSGGVDSMVLLHVLHALAQAHRWKLSVAHFDHQLRGRQSTADARFVERVAKSFGMRLVVGRGDVRAVSRRCGISIEMAARELRHAFLERTARQLTVRTVALAHHADDQVELFFLRLLRGGGGEGLAGMKWNSSSPAQSSRSGRRSNVRLVRPLLGVSKADLLQFAKQRKIKFREDTSNASLDHRRNRIRRELLPLLRKHYQPSLNQTILRSMEIIGAESDAVTARAEQWLQAKTLSGFDRLPVGVQRRCLQLQLLRLGVEAEFDRVEHLRLRAGEPMSVGSRRSIRRDRRGRVHLDQLRVDEVARHDSDATNRRVKLRTRRGQLLFGGVRIEFEITARRGAALPARIPTREFFDADKTGDVVVLRHWNPGDRFQPIGLDRSAKLQDLFTNLKVPRDLRHELLVATTARGEIFWVEGLRIGENFKMDQYTRRRLRWSWKRPDPG